MSNENLFQILMTCEEPTDMFNMMLGALVAKPEDTQDIIFTLCEVACAKRNTDQEQEEKSQNLS